jgi:hypothetical protein
MLATFAPLSLLARDNCPSGDCSKASGPLGDIFAMVFWAFVGITILWAIINRDIEALKDGLNNAPTTAVYSLIVRCSGFLKAIFTLLEKGINMKLFSKQINGE